MLEFEVVKERIEQGADPEMYEARDRADRINMHVTGLNAADFLDKLETFENNKQRELRKKLLKTSKSCVSFLLRPLDKVFAAKGGSINYNLSDSQIETLKQFTDDISDGLDIKGWLEKKAKMQHVIDPNGIMMIDADEEGEIEADIYKSHDILYYEKRGNHVKGIIFEPFMIDDKEDDKKYYRVIDEVADTIYVQDGNNIYEDETRRFDNMWGYVPAFVLGDTFDPDTSLFLSMLDDVLDDLNERFRDVTIQKVHKLSHGYPVYWTRPMTCGTCNGTGYVKNNETPAVEVDCPTCNTTGTQQFKDPSQIVTIPLPEENIPDPAPNIAGFVTPDLETWKQYNEDIRTIKDEAFETLWGKQFETEKRIETATKAILGEQSLIDRLIKKSQLFSKMHKFLLDGFGNVVFMNQNYESSVHYGTNFILESPDDALNRLEDAIKSGLSEIIIKDLQDKYYQSELANDNVEYSKKQKLCQVDPFPGMTATTVKGLGVMGHELDLKIYFPQWSMQVEEAKLLLMDIEQLKQDLDTYVKNKKLEDERTKQAALEVTRLGGQIGQA